MHSIEIRFHIGPDNSITVCRCVRAFSQSGNFTGWGSEGVNPTASFLLVVRFQAVASTPIDLHSPLTLQRLFCRLSVPMSRLLQHRSDFLHPHNLPHLFCWLAVLRPGWGLNICPTSPLNPQRACVLNTCPTSPLNPQCADVLNTCPTSPLNPQRAHVLNTCHTSP